MIKQQQPTITNIATPLEFFTKLKPSFSRAFIRSVGDGNPANNPDFINYKELNGNLGYNDTSGVANIISLLYDGVDHWYTISSEVLSTSAAAVQTAYNFAINTAGNQLTFATNGQPITSLTGTITVAGASRALTFVNATTASFTPAAYAGQTVTVTLTATNPFLTTSVTNVTVTNNSTVPAPAQTLTNFAINTAGNQVTFANSGTALTGLTGNITVAGVARTLTFVNATTASFTPVAYTGEVATITLLTTTPTIPVSVTNVSVTNNSTVPVPVLTKQTLSWLTAGVTIAGDNHTFTGAGATLNTAINTANPFEIKYSPNSGGLVILMDSTQPTSWGWPPVAALRDFGGFINTGVFAVSATSASENVLAPAQVVNSWFKFRKSGNDVIMSFSPTDTTYTDLKTFTGVLSGVPTVYPAFYSTSGGTRTINLQVYA
jgi:hypothetical protein